MANKRNTRSSALKAKVVLDASRERKTINEIAKQYSLHPTQIHQWKRLALDRFEELFVDGRSRKKTDESEISVEQLFGKRPRQGGDSARQFGPRFAVV